MDDEILSKAGLIVNPRSGKTSGKGKALAAVLRRESDVPVCIIDDFNLLPHYLDNMASAGVSDLFISSGDGTVQAIQTDLAERKPFTELPRLCLLPHGSTNMTAADLGLKSRSLAAQVEYIKKEQPHILRQRPTLRVTNPADGKVRHGMFLGTGSISEVTAFCQRVYNDKGVLGAWATFATFSRVATKIIFTKADPNDLTRFDRPYALKVESEGKVHIDGQYLMLITTTLEKLVLGTKPFWGNNMGPIRTSIFPYPLPNLFRWLPSLMYGTRSHRAPKGAMSLSTQSLDITSATNYVIDGEFFDGPAHEPLHLETGPVFTYLCG